MNTVTCTLCGASAPAYDGRVECMDCTRARSKRNHLKRHAHRLEYKRAYNTKTRTKKTTP